MCRITNLLHNFLWAVWLLCIAVQALEYCDRVFIKDNAQEKEGTFESPRYPETYPENLQCIFTFRARPGRERVKLKFDKFSVGESSGGECDFDYLDVFSDLPDENVNPVDQSINGRFCGTINPGPIVSLHHVIILILHTRSRSNTVDSSVGRAPDWKFNGTFQVIQAVEQYQIGTPAPTADCGYNIFSRNRQDKAGYIVSPTYPGRYPANYQCWYRLIGEPGERIRLKFEDFVIHFLGPHCPYDHLTIYDGELPTYPIITKICGNMQKLVKFSSGEKLFIEFVARDPPWQGSRGIGFKIRYEFSRQFVNIIDLIGGQSGIEHIRGTECDIRVKSGQKGISYFIKSPNYPHSYPKDKICTYILDGRQSIQDQEKVVLIFDELSITSRVAGCEDAYLQVYKNGQNPDDNEEDIEFCGNEIPPPIISLGARLVLQFKSGDIRGMGFKAKAQFVNDFGIAGEAVRGPNFCEFIFMSTQTKTGEINSPRNPSQYPINLTCIYYLNGTAEESVRLSFSEFKLHPGVGVQNYCGDYVEIINEFPNGLPNQLRPSRQLLHQFSQHGISAPYSQSLGKFCSNNHPGEYVSEYGAHSLRIIFKSDEAYADTGFKASFAFIPESPPFLDQKEDCGGRIEGLRGGFIQSRDFPHHDSDTGRYSKDLNCQWLIEVPVDHHVLLQFVFIELEGTMTLNTTSNTWASIDCKDSVIRVYKNITGPPMFELCGAKVEINILPQFLSDENMMRLSFNTGPRANGLKGFKAMWTDVYKPKKDQCGKHEFKCQTTEWCIDDEFMCNGYGNCGDTGDVNEPRDMSDENDPRCIQNDAPITPRPTPDAVLYSNTLLLVLIGSGVAAFLIIVVIISLLVRHCRHTKRSANLRNSVRFRLDEPGTSDPFVFHQEQLPAEQPLTTFSYT